MQVTFCKEKRFPDGSTELLIKDGYLQQLQSRERAQATRLFNQLEKESRQERLTAELNKTTFLEPRKRRKLELLLNAKDIENIKRSARRARQELYDICKCNGFQYFVTLTFDQKKIDRKNDEQTRRKFSQWANYVRKKFPNMFYTVTPEYHKKGGLHFHLLAGGITLDELKAVPATDKKGRPIFENGKQIYNINAWTVGFSQMSIIENLDAARHYICKYISKQRYDDRFFGKRRYYTSHNITRPEIIKTQYRHGEPWELNLDIWQVRYLDEKKRYGVFTTDGNGVVDTEYNAPDVRRKVATLATARKGDGPHARTSAAAAPRAGACPYSTIGTLNSVDRWQHYKTEFEKRVQATYQQTLARYRDELREIGLID